MASRHEDYPVSPQIFVAYFFWYCFHLFSFKKSLQTLSYGDPTPKNPYTSKLPQKTSVPLDAAPPPTRLAPMGARSGTSAQNDRRRWARPHNRTPRSCNGLLYGPKIASRKKIKNKKNLPDTLTWITAKHLGKLFLVAQYSCQTLPNAGAGLNPAMEDRTRRKL